MKISVLGGVVALLLLISCQKNCVTNDSRCTENIPTGEACQAFFQRWIFDKSTQKCELKAYSGCSAVGFETREACDKCKCN